MNELTIGNLLNEAAKFSEEESKYDEPSLYGVTDGKAVTRSTSPEVECIQNINENNQI